MTNHVWTFDTNAGPVVQLRGRTPAAIKTKVEGQIPLLEKRGYTHQWTRSGKWHVITIYNSKGRKVHAAAFFRGTFKK